MHVFFQARVLTGMRSTPPGTLWLATPHNGAVTTQFLNGLHVLCVCCACVYTCTVANHGCAECWRTPIDSLVPRSPRVEVRVMLRDVTLIARAQPAYRLEHPYKNSSSYATACITHCHLFWSCVSHL